MENRPGVGMTGAARLSRSDPFPSQTLLVCLRWRWPTRSRNTDINVFIKINERDLTSVFLTPFNHNYLPLLVTAFRRISPFILYMLPLAEMSLFLFFFKNIVASRGLIGCLPADRSWDPANTPCFSPSTTRPPWNYHIFHTTWVPCRTCSIFSLLFSAFSDSSGCLCCVILATTGNSSIVLLAVFIFCFVTLLVFFWVIFFCMFRMFSNLNRLQSTIGSHWSRTCLLPMPWWALPWHTGELTRV